MPLVPSLDNNPKFSADVAHPGARDPLHLSNLASVMSGGTVIIDFLASPRTKQWKKNTWGHATGAW
jgi:hypothetical protein